MLRNLCRKRKMGSKISAEFLLFFFTWVSIIFRLIQLRKNEILMSSSFVFSLIFYPFKSDPGHETMKMRCLLFAFDIKMERMHRHVIFSIQSEIIHLIYSHPTFYNKSTHTYIFIMNSRRYPLIYACTLHFILN